MTIPLDAGSVVLTLLWLAVGMIVGLLWGHERGYAHATAERRALRQMKAESWQAKRREVVTPRGWKPLRPGDIHPPRDE